MATSKKTSTSSLTFGLSPGEGELHAAESAMYEQLAKSMLKVRGGKLQEAEAPSFTKSILNVLNGPTSIERLAFETDPSQKNTYAGVYHAKLRLVPDTLLKRIAIQDSLVATIVRARQNQMSVFGRPRPNRFSYGFVIQPKPGLTEKMTKEEKAELTKEIKEAIALLSTCGHTQGVPETDRCTFSEFLSMVTRSALVNGRIAVEKLWVEEPSGGKKFHRFAWTDAGTIYNAVPNKAAAQSIRDEAFHLLQSILGDDAQKKLTKERYEADEYTLVQVIEGKPVQVFTNQEMAVYNFYPVPDVEMNGYPVTPIDTVIAGVTTHINITTHNKLYFQSGRATRGMLVIKSDDANPTAIHNIKQQFNASINNVSNSWRMPVFGCAVGEEITWQPIDSGGGRDAEFQYLADMNMREILSAFMMSPDELPGYAYLSKGTNNQSLSESNNEYKLEAARDLGIRPLVAQMEDFVNSHLFPLLCPNLYEKVEVRFLGLDADNAEKEAVRIQQDMSNWMTYDDVMERVEKPPVGKEWGGAIPLNVTFKSYLDQYYTVGEIKEKFCGIAGAGDAQKNPMEAYKRDPFFFQWVQRLDALQQAQQQAQAQQQGGGGAAPPGGGGGGGSPPPQGGGDDSGGGSDQPAPQTQKQMNAASPDAQGSGASGGGDSDLGKAVDQAYELLTKSEASLPANKRRLLAGQRATVDYFMRGFLEDANETVKEILAVAEHHTPKHRRPS
jgi:hypothetical protein